MLLSKIKCAQHPYGKEYESENVGVRFISTGCCAEPANKSLSKPKEIRLKSPIETGRTNPTPTRIRKRDRNIPEIYNVK